jgi:acetylornithine deacetylase
MDPLPLLRDLVAVNSVNPGLVAGAPGEREAAEVCAAAMRGAGLDVELQIVRPGRPNAIGVLEGRSPGPSIMLCGHIDTVGTQGMTDPFVPRVDEGRLYGRGAQDMKGGVAAMIAAAAQLAAGWTHGRLIVAVVVDEEHESIGAEALVRQWSAGPDRSRRPDAAIITEPTDLAVAIAHKGFAWLDIVTRGRAAHGSRPREGRDAIFRMGRVLGALEQLDRDLQARPPVALEGTASLHASIVSGGRELSSYPDHCALQMERRTVSGETESVVRQEIEDVLAALRRADPELEADAQLVAYRPAYRLDAGHRLVRTLSAALAATGRPAEPTGMSFWTDAAILGQAGIPTLLFGPGGAGLHSLVEYVNVDDVYACRDVLAETVTRWVRAAP